MFPMLPPTHLSFKLELVGVPAFLHQFRVLIDAASFVCTQNTYLSMGNLSDVRHSKLDKYYDICKTFFACVQK